MTCDSCGHELPSDARFCPACGAPAATTVTSTERPAETVAATAPPPSEADAEADADAVDADAVDADAVDADAVDADAVDAEAAGDGPDAPGGEPAPAASGKTRFTPAAILGGVLAVAAGGTLGVLAGLAIVQVM